MVKMSLRVCRWLKGQICTAHLKRMFLRSQQPLIVPPAFYEGESSGLSSSMGQSVDNILEKKQKQNVRSKGLIAKCSNYGN